VETPGQLATHGQQQLVARYRTHERRWQQGPQPAGGFLTGEGMQHWARTLRGVSGRPPAQLTKTLACSTDTNAPHAATAGGRRRSTFRAPARTARAARPDDEGVAAPAPAASREPVAAEPAAHASLQVAHAGPLVLRGCHPWITTMTGRRRITGAPVPERQASIRVRGGIRGSPNHRNVRESQSVRIMINPMVSPRTRSRREPSFDRRA
jgi:hypothetical protein